MKEQLQILCNVYALFLVHKHLGDFLSTGSITAKQGSLANDQLRSLYSQVSLRHLSCKIYFIILRLLSSNYCVIIYNRSAPMPLPLLMHLTTLTTTLAQFLADMMGMCTRNFTRRRGKILWMTRLCQRDIMNTSNLCWSNSSEIQGYDYKQAIMIVLLPIKLAAICFPKEIILMPGKTFLHIRMKLKELGCCKRYMVDR